MAGLDARMAEPEIAASYEKLSPLAEERRALAREHQGMLEEWEAFHRDMESP
jgi:hypothetical protein